MSASLISRSGSSAFSAIRVRGHWPTKILVEGEELQTNLLQVSQRGPASSSVLDEVFGTHRSKIFPTHVLRTTGTTPPVQHTPGVPPSPTGQLCINSARRH